MINVAESTAPVNRVFIADLGGWAGGRFKVLKLVDNFDAQYGCLANDDTRERL